jgi:hypothetical protein
LTARRTSEPPKKPFPIPLLPRAYGMRRASLPPLRDCRSVGEQSHSRGVQPCSSGRASAEAEETVLANIATEGHKPNRSQKEIEKSPVRPADLRFATSGTCKCHGRKSPENPWVRRSRHAGGTVTPRKKTDNPGSRTLKTKLGGNHYDAPTNGKSQSEQDKFQVDFIWGFFLVKPQSCNLRYRNSSAYDTV